MFSVKECVKISSLCDVTDKITVRFIVCEFPWLSSLASNVIVNDILVPTGTSESTSISH